MDPSATARRAGDRLPFLFLFLFPFLLALTALPAPGLAAEAEEAEEAGGQPWRGLSAEQWRADLRYLDRELRLRHADLFHIVPEPEFAEAVAELYRQIPTLEDDAVVVAMARLIARVGDGHTRISESAHVRDEIYPLRLRLFPEGLHVVGTGPEHEGALGARVVAVGEVPVEEILPALEELTAGDNAMNRRHRMAENLVVPTFLHGLGIVDDPAAVRFELQPAPSGDSGEGPGGRVSVVLKPEEREAIAWRFLHQRLEPPPLFLSRLSETFWLEHLEDEGTLYVQVNAVRDGDDETMEAFYGRVLDTARDEAVERLVLDLRFNGGGNGFLNWPLVYGLIRHPELHGGGRLAVLIGRQTYSAAGQLAALLERHTEAVFVGEPTGASPNHYGDAKPFFLPHSGLRIGASSLYWQIALPWDDRPWLPPDLSAGLGWEDYRQGRDPALAVIGRHLGDEPLADRLRRALETGGIPAVREAYGEYRRQPIHRWADTEPELNRLGYELLWEGETEAALGIFHLNAEAHPDSANVYDSLGEAYLEAGEEKEARRFYLRALEIEPGRVSARSALEGMGKPEDR